MLLDEYDARWVTIKQNLNPKNRDKMKHEQRQIVMCKSNKPLLSGMKIMKTTSLKLFETFDYRNIQ